MIDLGVLMISWVPLLPPYTARLLPLRIIRASDGLGGVVGEPVITETPSTKPMLIFAQVGSKSSRFRLKGINPL